MAEEAAKQKMPLGVIILMILTVFGILGSLSSIVQIMLSPTEVPVLGIALSGISLAAYMLVFLIIEILIFYGLWKRESWLPMLVYIYFGFGILSALVSFATFGQVVESSIDAALQQQPDMPVETVRPIIEITLIASLAISLVYSLVVIAYIYKKRDYFAAAK